MSDIVTRLNEALTDRYAIERELGEGGMATVYLARDVRHNRSVAIKVLKPELAAVVGAERFLAEIETTANLQHPHILPLFDSGEADGFLFYVMPYIEGETLRERIDREGQLPVDEAVGIAIAIANALQTAHDAGVVHRDIKPANILLSRGQPLVADFGIALAVHAGGDGRMTETGLSLGTPYYMSPEQATGDQAVGPAADVYALGSVLYEMLIGEPPYPGNSAQAVLGKILQGAPPSATATRRSIPLNVDGAILKALEKLPADRFPSAKDFAAALSSPAFRYGPGAEAQMAGGGRSWALVAGALAVTTLVLGVLAGWVLLRPPPQETFNQLTLAIDEAVSGEISLGNRGRMSFSPDGRRLVFVGPAPDFGTQLWVRDMSRLEARTIPGTEGASNPSVSPDGLDVAYTTSTGASGRQLRRVPLDGGPSLLLSDSLIDSGGVSWGWDGWIYTDAALEGDGFARVPETGGPPEIVTTPVGDEDWHAAPFALPDGRGVLFYAAGVEMVGIVDLETGEHTTLVDGVWGAYAESGHLVWVTRDGTLMAQPFDPDSFELSGRPVPLDENLVAPEGLTGGSAAVLSREGDLAYIVGGSVGEATTLSWVDRSGRAELFDSTWVATFWQVALSPDGSRLAAMIREDGVGHLWVRALDGSPPRRLAVDDVWDPTWLPGGEWIGYSTADGIVRRRADGTGGAEVVVADDGAGSPDWTSDGEWLVYVVGGAILGQRLGDDGRPDGDPQVLVDDYPGFEGMPKVSPDGRWLAFTSLLDGGPRVYVRPFPETDQASWVLADRSAASPRWIGDGSELQFVEWPQAYVGSIDVAADDAFTPAAPESLFRWAPYRLLQGGRGSITSTPDGERLLMIDRPGSGAAEQLILVQNVFGLLDERVGN